MSNDNGATWTTLLSYDSTSVVPIPGIHPVVDLTANSGETVQFAIYASGEARKFHPANSTREDVHVQTSLPLGQSSVVVLEVV